MQGLLDPGFRRGDEVEDGVRCMLRGIERKQRRVYFPWPLSFFMQYVLAPMPDFLYDPLVLARGPVRKKAVD